MLLYIGIMSCVYAMLARYCAAEIGLGAKSGDTLFKELNIIGIHLVD